MLDSFEREGDGFQRYDLRVTLAKGERRGFDFLTKVRNLGDGGVRVL